MIDLLLFKDGGESLMSKSKVSKNDILVSKTADNSNNNYTICEDVNDEFLTSKDAIVTEEHLTSLSPKKIDSNGSVIKGNEDQHADKVTDISDGNVLKITPTLRTGSNNLRKFYKCKDQAGNIILIPIESLPLAATRLSSSSKSMSMPNGEQLLKDIPGHNSTVKNGISSSITRNATVESLNVQPILANQRFSSQPSLDQNVIKILRPGTSLVTSSTLKGDNQVSILKASVGANQTPKSDVQVIEKFCFGNKLGRNSQLTSVLRNSSVAPNSLKRILTTVKCSFSRSKRYIFFYNLLKVDCDVVMCTRLT